MGRRTLASCSLGLVPKQEIYLQKDAKILGVVNTNGPRILFEKDESANETEGYSIRCYNIGQELLHDDSYIFLGAVNYLNGFTALAVYYKKL